MPTRHSVRALAIALAAASGAHAQCVEGCDVIATLLGEAPGDQFGWKSNNIGDIDGDDANDFVITSPGNDVGGSNAGRAYVYSGADGTLVFDSMIGSPGWRLGIDANAAGDVDGDGVPDFIVGAPFVGAGRAIVYSGADGSMIVTLNGEHGGDQFGFRVAGGRDVSGDGVPDVLVTANLHDPSGRSNAGRVYVYSGADFSLVCLADGGAAGDQLGTAANMAGDLFGDPRSEFVVGARDAGPGSRGQAYVFTPGKDATCDIVFTLDPPEGHPAVDFGHLFADGDGDVDADGTPDVYVGDFPANRAHVYSGETGAHLLTMQGDNGGQFGLGEIVNDVNNDGHDDLFLAAWVSNQGGTRAGKAFVYSGADGEVLETFTHDIPGATFGFDAKGLDDVNGDGRADYVVTAASDQNNRGVAYLIAGTIGGFLGDLNGDGVVDFADLLLLLALWGDCPEPPMDCPADLDGNGTVNFNDLLLLLSNWS